METLQLGIFAALLQVAGYAFYGSKILRHDIRPNATSWLMFAYGTTLLFIVEWDRDASFALLALPAACALSSVFVAFYALRKARGWWPVHTLERFSFVLDILLTLVYLGTWILLAKGLIADRDKDLTEILILICVNITTFTAFYPLLRQVYNHPYTEHAVPWTIWSLAYTLLAVVTFVENGWATELMLYPLSNICMHGYVAAHTALWRYRHNEAILS